MVEIMNFEKNYSEISAKKKGGASCKYPKTASTNLKCLFSDQRILKKQK